jgi:hypothetical protein
MVTHMGRIWMGRMEAHFAKLTVAFCIAFTSP